MRAKEKPPEIGEAGFYMPPCLNPGSFESILDGDHELQCGESTSQSAFQSKVSGT